LLLKEWVKVNNGQERKEMIIRPYTEADFDSLIKLQRACFPPPFPDELLWNEDQLKEHVIRFPQGAICAEIDQQVVGSMTTLLTTYHLGDQHTWSEVTDHGYIRNHNPQGNTLYVVDISVHPDFRSSGIGRRLLQAMYYLVVELKIDRLLGGGRMPNYHLYADKLTAEEYLEEVLKGNIGDPVISFMLNSGRIPYGVVQNYLEDEESLNYAALMAWENPFKKMTP